MSKKKNYKVNPQVEVVDEKFEASEEKMASDALASGSPANTRKAVIKEDIIAIYDRLRLA